MRVIRVHVPKLLVTLKAAKDQDAAKKLIDDGSVSFDEHPFLGTYLILKVK